MQFAEHTEITNLKCMNRFHRKCLNGKAVQVCETNWNWFYISEACRFWDLNITLLALNKWIIEIVSQHITTLHLGLICLMLKPSYKQWCSKLACSKEVNGRKASAWSVEQTGTLSCFHWRFALVSLWSLLIGSGHVNAQPFLLATMSAFRLMITFNEQQIEFSDCCILSLSPSCFPAVNCEVSNGCLTAWRCVRSRLPCWKSERQRLFWKRLQAVKDFKYLLVVIEKFLTIIPSWGEIYRQFFFLFIHYSNNGMKAFDGKILVP